MNKLVYPTTKRVILFILSASLLSFAVLGAALKASRACAPSQDSARRRSTGVVRVHDSNAAPRLLAESGGVGQAGGSRA